MRGKQRVRERGTQSEGDSEREGQSEREREKYRERDGEPPEYIVSYRGAQSKLLLWFLENSISAT